MEATGRDGGREQTGTSSSYTISSTSGTVSTGYTSNGSHLSWISMEAARHFREMEGADEFVQPVKKTHKETEKQHTELAIARLKEMSIKTAREMKIEQIKSLSNEIFGAPWVKCSIQGADMSVLERWFNKLGVGWVLHVTAGKLEHTLDASSWIRALSEIMDAFCLTTSLFCGHEEAPNAQEAQEGAAVTEGKEEDITDLFQFASFTEQAMLQMLAFVDFIAAPNVTCQVFFTDQMMWVPAPYRKLHTLLRVRGALSRIRSSYSPPSVEAGRIRVQVFNVWSAKEGKVSEAIWSTMEEIRTRILESIDGSKGSSGTQTPQGSSDIDETTRSLMNYVTFLRDDHMLVNTIVSEAASLGKYVPRIGEVPPLWSLAVEMVSCLEQNLVNKSENFLDQSLRFLFLLNNSSFIRDLLSYTCYFPKSYKETFNGKVQGYMESYIQISWAPEKLLPLPKFESEFGKIYTAQKLWKVPNPYLRKTLREAIIEKIIPGYEEYIENNHVTTSKFTPRNLEEMLHELFEG
uniref:Exocyst subunit Exo70 family protein n=1 Tax=Setaria viridis TaxID=4556 RepID=A0A4U6VH40_SETVI|nr:hypothetical protein SEVIR_4G298200v2 [Setaria viridis]